MMLSIPSGLDLRSHTERMAGICIERKRRSAIRYMRKNRVVQFLINGGFVVTDEQFMAALDQRAERCKQARDRQRRFRAECEGDLKRIEADASLRDEVRRLARNGVMMFGRIRGLVLG